VASCGVRDAISLTGHSGPATLTGMSVEFPLSSPAVVLIPGTGVLYTVAAHSAAAGGALKRGTGRRGSYPKHRSPDGSGPRSAAGRVMNIETVEGEYVPGPDGYLR
jgi:hypothetical protein